MYDATVELRRTHHGWAEPQPTHCEACGTTLGPNRVLVGAAQCAACPTAHRTHTCTTCWSTSYTPPRTERCDLRALDNRAGAADG